MTEKPKMHYEVDYPRYCNRREGWVVEYKVVNGKDVHGATEGFVKKRSFEDARNFYNELKCYEEAKRGE